MQQRGKIGVGIAWHGYKCWATPHSPVCLPSFGSEGALSEVHACSQEGLLLASSRQAWAGLPKPGTRGRAWHGCGSSQPAPRPRRLLLGLLELPAYFLLPSIPAPTIPPKKTAPPKAAAAVPARKPASGAAVRKPRTKPLFGARQAAADKAGGAGRRRGGACSRCAWRPTPSCPSCSQRCSSRCGTGTAAPCPEGRQRQCLQCIHACAHRLPPCTAPRRPPLPTHPCTRAHPPACRWEASCSRALLRALPARLEICCTECRASNWRWVAPHSYKQ